MWVRQRMLRDPSMSPTKLGEAGWIHRGILHPALSLVVVGLLAVRGLNRSVAAYTASWRAGRLDLERLRCRCGLVLHVDRPGVVVRLRGSEVTVVE